MRPGVRLASVPQCHRYTLGTARLVSSTTTARASLLFFFQAEDGIRDLTVTGVQTCALPISLLAPRLTVAADGRALAPQWVGLETISERQSLRLRLRFALHAPPGTVEVTTRMFPYDPAHQTFLNVYEGSALTQAILDGAHDRFEYFAGTRQGAVAVIEKFLPAGIHHILIGPDHLLFLVGLLLLGGTIRQPAVAVTALP